MFVNAMIKYFFNFVLGICTVVEKFTLVNAGFITNPHLEYRTSKVKLRTSEYRKIIIKN